MIYIYGDTMEVLSNWTAEKDGLLLLPNKSVSSFIVKSLDKYGILRAKEEVLNLVEKKKNVSISQIEDVFADKHYLDIYSKPNRGQTELLFKKTVENISEGRDIYCSIDAFVLFMEWAKDNYSEMDQEIYYEGSPEDIISSYGDVKLKPITLNNLDKLLKLFCLFYGKSIPKEDIFLISEFQYKLIEMNFKFFNDLDEVISIVDNKFSEHKETLPANNIFNKILEMLENLKMIENDYYTDENISLKVLFPTKEIIDRYSKEFENMLGN